ncbi:MAG: PEP-CTERM sorting domain-containing protein [Phycisphaera sp.]|nr:PEP-CTERM sorting domain-containing protein [Phycisphaera sp.]
MKARTFATSLVASAGLIVSAHAATISDPTLYTVIDPAGVQDVTSAPDESWGTSQATLEARSDLKVMQDFAGFTGGSGGNIVAFTDPTLPDIRFAMTTDDPDAGGAITSDNFNSSAGSALLFDNDGSVTPVLTISFGTWNGSTFTADQTVDAAGFVLTQVLNSSIRHFDVTFKDSGGNTITQFLNLAGDATATTGTGADTSTDGSWPEIYVGWDATAQNTNKIAQIVIAVSDGSASSSGFDDLAFTTIPEPASLALMGFGGLLLLPRRK